MKFFKIVTKRKLGALDIIIFLCILAMLYLIISPSIGKNLTAKTLVISTDVSNLPKYALFSTIRMTIAYILSLIFTFIYGYIASHNEKAERVMIPVLDILQSIPVLSFLPAVVIGLIAIFPNSPIGIELSCIILIFTGQVWNMTFSFYNSTKLVPKDLREAAGILQLNKWQVFKKLELPFSTIGLVWNSMMSWAGGWFFLMACETFTLRGRDFRLPGLGSYLQQAASEGNNRALYYGIFTLLLVIILLDQLVWRPVIAWSDKFKIELTEAGDAPRSFVLTLIKRSVIIEWLSEKMFTPLNNWVNKKIDNMFDSINKNEKVEKNLGFKIFSLGIRAVFVVIIIYATYKAIRLVLEVSPRDFGRILPAVGYSFFRVLVAQIIALAWTVPVGVAVGMNKRLANIFQPIIQIVASMPATALFPLILAYFINIAGGLNLAAIILMLMGTQWYILFNVIAGAMAIPEDLKAASKTFGLRGIKKWRILILPSIFPQLVTGMITATGGCWNASIVSEYVNFSGHTTSTIGLGALISEASEVGNFPLLLLSTIVMCVVVVGLNKFVWKRLYVLAETKFKVEL